MITYSGNHGGWYLWVRSRLRVGMTNVGVGAKVAPAALSVVAGRLSHDEPDFDGVAQANEAVAEPCFPIKGLDFVLQMTEFTNRAGESLTRTHEPHVVPHDVLDGLHVTLDECRVRLMGQVAFIPAWGVGGVRHGEVGEYAHEMLCGTFAVHEAFEQRGACKAIGAM